MKKMVSFLQSVARACFWKYPEMTDFCFIFPNKRSRRFFLEELAKNLGNKGMIAPDALSVSEFMERVSGYETASRIDMLFRLYNVYRAQRGLATDLRTDEGMLDFDRFAPWADTVLSDFSEVDQFEVDASSIFKNVRDYREIQSNFLTEEQRDVIERYFGYQPSWGDVADFWRKCGLDGENGNEEGIRQRFVELWQVFADLYTGLRADLEGEGLAMPGSTFRIALDKVREEGRSALPWKKVIVVGFNMLSTTEAKLFEEMAAMKDEEGEPYAEFFWDATGPVLDPAQGASGLPAAAIGRFMRRFPMPRWSEPFMELSRSEEMPAVINVAASPSNSAQAKLAMMQINEWMTREKDPVKIDRGTAIVVPDENLLMPLIHSLPDGIGDYNLTMGFSMRFTSIASFIFHLRRLQSRVRKGEDGSPGFYHEDLKLFMRHPLVHVALGGRTANLINTDIQNAHRLIVTVDWLRKRSETLADMLRPLPKGTTVAETVDYICSVLDTIDAALDKDEKGAGKGVNTKIERILVAHYRQALMRLHASVVQHGIEMRPSTVFHIVDRLLASETVSFQGEPLRGLQIMGLLETRALDFDRIIVLSMNDKILPRRSSRRTYIPETIRRGYGLPSASQGEELSSYYFYRLLSRAKEVTLIYDARAGEGLRSGGKSRFLMQLEMLYARDRVKEKTYVYGLETTAPEVSDVQKTESVMELLEEFCKEEKGRNLSASALMNYCSCPVKFYYNNVVGLKDDIEVVDYITPLMQGNIVHKAMENLYLPDVEKQGKYLEAKDRPELLDVDFKRFLEDPERIPRVVKRAVNEEFYKLRGEDLDREIEGTIAMTLPYLEQVVRKVVEADRRHAPITIVGCEIGGRVRFKAGSAPEVNIRFAIDRVDIVDGRMRIIDYKTGKSRVSAGDMEDVFNGSDKAKYILQLMLYSKLLEMVIPDCDRHYINNLAIEIMSIGDDSLQLEVVPVLAKERIESASQISEEFMQGVEEMMLEIYNPEVPFSANPEGKGCKYCSYASLCGKEI